MKGEEHEFRCAVASFDTLDEHANVVGRTRWLETESALDLWLFATDFTTTEHRTVAFAHNLSYDLRLTSALKYLPMMGFECSGIALTNYSCWAKFKNNNKSLWLVDSLSFVPASLEKIATAVRMDKLPLPDDDEPNDEWLMRCMADVRITREAVLRVLAYIKKNDLGDFRLTGSAQSSAAFRHRFMPAKTLLVHDDLEALAKERKASWSGRAEVWRHGEYSNVVYEMDYEYAYARLAYDHMVPVKLLSDHSGIPWDRLLNVMDHYAVLADVTVTTDVPCVPTEKNDSVVWPVGTFDTVLWDHELRLAVSEGATVRINRYWQYKRAYLLRDWARWIMDLLELPSSKLDPVVRYMLKDWSRSLIGRFGLRYNTLDQVAVTPNYDLRLFGVVDIDNSEELEYLQLGQQLFERMAKEESPNSTPQVMSSIMSAGRVRLWNAISHAGTENILYVDTDGVFTNREGKDRISNAVVRGALRGIRLKATYNGGVFRSPRNIDLGNIRRVSGAPRKAERLAPGIYRGEVWESLPTALKRGHIGKVFVHERTFEVSERDKRREHLDDGNTAAWAMG